MRRRDLLSLGAAAVGLSGCMGVVTEQSPSNATTTGSTPATPLTATPVDDEPAGASIGVSAHGRPWRINDRMGLIDESGTEWLHAFLDVRRLFFTDVDLENHPNIRALRRASRDHGARLFVSLQWNFIGIFGEQDSIHIPDPNSRREQEMIRFAVEVLEAIGEPVAVVGLGNEPIWETIDADFMGEDAPMIPFIRRMTDHVTREYTVGEPRFIHGAFNRLYSEYVREEYATFNRRLLELARDHDRVDGIDLHIHYASLEDAERMLGIARQWYPDGMITTTEFSPIWRYDQHKREQIRSYPGGVEFLREYGIPGDVQVDEYLELKKETPMSHEEAEDFYGTMPWYNVNFVDDMYHLLEKYGAEIGTFCFLTEDDVDQLDWTGEWAPFPLNCLFQPALIGTENGPGGHGPPWTGWSSPGAGARTPPSPWSGSAPRASRSRRY